MIMSVRFCVLLSLILMFRFLLSVLSVLLMRRMFVLIWVCFCWVMCLFVSFSGFCVSVGRVKCSFCSLWCDCARVIMNVFGIFFVVMIVCCVRGFVFFIGVVDVCLCLEVIIVWLLGM